MEQGGGGRGGFGMREMQQQQQQQQDQRKENQQQQQHPPPPPQQSQKCPRCESLNTKFCYYNNYSLSQPRYFCKTCRRYWTQGGTLRNVPVGGGCRKGKRLKRSSSPSPDNLSTSTSTSSIPLPLPIVSPLRSKGIDSISSSPLLPIGAAGVGPPSMYYPGGGFLSSLAAFQSFNQPINVGGGEFGGSNLSLLQGFSLPFHTQQMHHHHQQQQQHLYLHQSHDLNLGSSDGLDEKIIQPDRPSTSHQEWSQSFNNPPPISSEATGYWNSNNNSTTPTSTTSTIGASLNPTHWTDHLGGYAPPPPPPITTSTTSSPPSFLGTDL